MPNLNVSTRLDGIDEERFRDMTESESFRLFAARVGAQLERARKECETQYGVTIPRAQGQVQAYRTVLDLPAIILSEMKARR